MLSNVISFLFFIIIIFFKALAFELPGQLSMSPMRRVVLERQNEYYFMASAFVDFAQHISSFKNVWCVFLFMRQSYYTHLL